MFTDNQIPGRLSDNLPVFEDVATRGCGFDTDLVTKGNGSTQCHSAGGLALQCAAHASVCGIDQRCHIVIRIQNNCTGHTNSSIAVRETVCLRVDAVNPALQQPREVL